MRFLFAVILVIGVASAGSNFGDTGFISSASPPVPSDGTLYEQPYDFPNLVNAIYVHGPQFGGADNFTFTGSGIVHSLTFWMVYSGSGHPFDIAVDFYTDASGAMGTHMWGETVPAAYQTETLTGDQQWGFDLYRNDLQFQTFPTIPAGDYWISMSVLGATDNVGWLVCDPTYPPNMMQYNNGWNTIAFDGWFGLYDHDVALARTTWASIKAAY